MKEARTQILLHGSEEPAPDVIRLRAGPLSLFFEPQTVFLRQICLDDREVIRAIYGAVRDRHWGTVNPRIEGLNVQSNTNAFQLRFGVDCRAGAIQFYWHGEITGTADGTIVFCFDGQTQTGFWRNRIGICVLHPLSCAGKPFEVEKVDGTVEQGRFPRLVAPHQPCQDLRALNYEPMPGVSVEIRCEGDVFEVEDQRNWTDASFKTYSTPLELPWPVWVEAGVRIRQMVTIRLRRNRAIEVHTSETRPRIELDLHRGRPVPRPTLGLGMARHGRPLTEVECERLEALGLDHLRADLYFSRSNWPAILTQADREAGDLGWALHLALFVSDQAEAELRQFVTRLATTRSRISLLMVFHQTEAFTSERWIGLAREIVIPHLPQTPLAAGTNAHFAEWNRGWTSSRTRALPCFSLNPQVHAFDAQTLMENLEAQSEVVACAYKRTGQPVVVSPITLRPRAHLHASSYAPSLSEEVPADADPRQKALIAAAWTLGSLRQLWAGDRVHSLTYYETTGDCGLLPTSTEVQMSSPIPALPGAVFPVWHVFREVGQFRKCIQPECAHPRQVAVLAGYDQHKRFGALVANLTAQTSTAYLALGPMALRARVLCGANVESAMRDPQTFLSQPGLLIPTGQGWWELPLPPYALVAFTEKA